MTSEPELAATTDKVPVSILFRLLVAFAYVVPALGAAFTAYLVTRVLHAMRIAESAGVGAVTGGLSEANVPVLISLYLAIVIGLAALVTAVVRLTMSTTKAAPPLWFFPLAAILALSPALLVWQAESILINALRPSSGGVSEVAPTIELLLTSAMILAPVALLLLLIGSFVPLSIRSRPKYSVPLTMLVVQVLLVVFAVAFQIRTSWLRAVMMNERF